jgi:tryptophanyl-tRNA synthetase
MKLVLSGIQPTGVIHLGNYLGAVKNWSRLQKNYESLFLIVDMHAITSSYFKISHGGEVAKNLRYSTLLTAATLKSCGIKNIFIQSHVPEHALLMWIFSCISPMSWFQKMTQFKEKKLALDGASLGIFSYPALMAADILLYKTSFVPVGDDQTQHIELAKDIAQRFNSLFSDYFPIPEPLLCKKY